MTNGLFGDLFDYNGDGKLDAFEQACEIAFVMDMEKASMKEEAIQELESSGRYDWEEQDVINVINGENIYNENRNETDDSY